MWLLTLLVLIIILGIIILVHEFGHFIWAKTFKVFIYEFSLGITRLSEKSLVNGSHFHSWMENIFPYHHQQQHHHHHHQC